MKHWARELADRHAEFRKDPTITFDHCTDGAPLHWPRAWSPRRADVPRWVPMEYSSPREVRA